VPLIPHNAALKFLYIFKDADILRRFRCKRFDIHANAVRWLTGCRDAKYSHENRKPVIAAMLGPLGPAENSNSGHPVKGGAR